VSNVAKALRCQPQHLYRKLTSSHRVCNLNEARDPADADNARLREEAPRSRFAWCITARPWPGRVPRAGRTPAGVDLLLSAAGEEVLEIYKLHIEALKPRFRVFRDKTAAACGRHAL